MSSSFMVEMATQSAEGPRLYPPISVGSVPLGLPLVRAGKEVYEVTPGHRCAIGLCESARCLVGGR